MEISKPNLYDTPLSGRIIVKVDLLSCLTSIWGEACQIYREPLYKIVSGSCTEEEHNALIASFYRRFPEVTEYINNLFYYGEKSIPINQRVVSAIAEIVEEYKNTVLTTLTNAGGKYLVLTHDYVYFSFIKKPELSELKGVNFIC